VGHGLALPDYEDSLCGDEITQAGIIQRGGESRMPRASIGSWLHYLLCKIINHLGVGILRGRKRDRGHVCVCVCVCVSGYCNRK
jgi:hypothetical protein